MAWQDRIVVDPQIAAGKPIVKNTRLAGHFLLELLAQGWAQEDILANYPQLTRDDLLAALAYASETLRNEALHPLKARSARGSWQTRRFPPLLLGPYSSPAWTSRGSGKSTPASNDRRVMQMARSEGRVLITFDKDFAELVFHESAQEPSGVILLNPTPRSPQNVTDTLWVLVQGEQDWSAPLLGNNGQAHPHGTPSSSIGRHDHLCRSKRHSSPLSRALRSDELMPRRRLALPIGGFGSKGYTTIAKLASAATGSAVTTRSPGVPWPSHPSRTAPGGSRRRGSPVHPG